MKRIVGRFGVPHVALVALLAVGCGGSTTMPTTAPSSALASTPATPTPTPAVAPTVVVTSSPNPFRVGTPGHIMIQVSGVSSEATMDFGDGTVLSLGGAALVPDAVIRTDLVHIYVRQGTFTVTATSRRPAVPRFRLLRQCQSFPEL